ncbi:MAG: type II secretion system major pseudopilin GspG [Verrucomicrobiia bacterium]
MNAVRRSWLSGSENFESCGVKLRGTMGFTLLEIMLVVVIMGILMTVAVVKLGGKTKMAQIAATQADIKAFSQAIALFEMDCGSYPSTEQGLQALVVQPSNCTNWKGPYIESGKIKDDPWGSKYIYKCPGEKLPHSFDLYSPGPDKIEGTEDDIGNWQ